MLAIVPWPSQAGIDKPLEDGRTLSEAALGSQQRFARMASSQFSSAWISQTYCGKMAAPVSEHSQKEYIPHLVPRLHEGAQIFVIVVKTIIFDTETSDQFDNVKANIQAKGSEQLKDGCISIHYVIKKDPTLHSVPRPCGGMPILVQKLDGKAISLDVEASNMIDNVKARVQDSMDIPPDQWCMIFAGEQLEVDRTISGIQKGTPLHLMLRRYEDIQTHVKNLTRKTFIAAVTTSAQLDHVKANFQDKEGDQLRMAAFFGHVFQQESTLHLLLVEAMTWAQ